MTLTWQLTKEPAGAARLRQVAPWLIVLSVGAALLVPGILFELGQRPSGDQSLHSTVAATAASQSR